ncbi:eukaryotic-like serine/threonine-protein kinase [Burkholderiaceae bacterium]|nr:eukaryotic-like serine/threonine-protein kinase [Burkholderiaceae bacterium]
MSIPNAPVPGQNSPPDSEPAVPPSVPNAALWGDSDIGVPLLPPQATPDTPRAAATEKAPEPTATIGHIGRYALKYRIGEGGLGTVYAAHDPLLSRLIAIKTLNLEIAADQRSAFNALFLNEARAAAGLSHPNIVTVFDAGVSDDNAYIAMELLKGRDLRQLRQEGWRPTPTQAALIVRRVADALAYAHSKGVVHRDIKPANIFMVGRTQPRVLDFGIARVAHQHEAHAGDDVAAGSPYYMAPEQVRQQPVDRRADVFSLGVVLYELLTDQKPFRGSTLSEITSAVLDHEPPLATLVNKDVPKPLADIAARAMEKDPEHRFRSARALSRELRHWLEENGQANEGAEPASRERQWAWLGGSVAAALVIGVGVWWAAASDETPVEPVVATAAVAPAIEAASAAAVPLPAEPASEPAIDIAIAAGDSAGSPIPTESSEAASAAHVIAASARNSTAKTPPRETARERRAREAREREARAITAAPAAGVIRLAVSPWGQVEVDGTPVGTAPPLNEITLSEGRHQLTIRNADFPPYSASINVTAGQPLTIKHRFGS